MRDWSCVPVLVCLLSSVPCFAESPAALTAGETEAVFLDRLMAVESSGRLNAKNPHSSALGPYQFVRDTFLDVIKRRFPQLTVGKTDEEILALRTDLTIARNAALTYTRENASHLAAHGKPVSAANLRLSFFIGPGGAVKVLDAKPEEPLTGLLSEAALAANPGLGSSTAGQLIEKTSRETKSLRSTLNLAAISDASPAIGDTPHIKVQCNLKLPSCKKWLALAEKRLGVREASLTAASLRR